MNQVRKSSDRGYFDHGWLKSHHSFSFGEYRDPRYMGWGNLRVINEDYIASGKGFGTHGHSDMEIVTYVLSGALAHQDSMGNIETIPPGDVQRMSAGTGVRHSEFNHAKDQETHLLQIWIEPNELGAEPGYEQISIDVTRKRGALTLVAAPWATHKSSVAKLPSAQPTTQPPSGAKLHPTSAVASQQESSGFVKMHADAFIYAGYFDGQEHTQLDLDPKRKAYLHVVKGQIQANGAELHAGDALMIQNESVLNLKNGHDAEVLFFDLAA
jgi:redox-sensitive bicupin YhaK (pirin superfamily)